MPSPRFLWLSAASIALAACTTPPPAPPAPVEPVAPPPVEVVAPPPPPPTPATQQQAQKVALAAVDLLEAGNEEQAKAELLRALAGDPNNKLAQNLLRQINADPIATLGRESFPYTVKPSDTLSRISGRFLGDIYSFYILARYNDIKIPRQVAGGQVIRIPGKAPPPGTLDLRGPTAPASSPATAPVAAPIAAPSPPPPAEPSPGDKAMRSAEAAERSGDLERAYAEYRRAAALDQPQAAAKAEQMRKQLILPATVNARSAFAKQDLDGAIKNWDRVLELDPGNETAKLERQKAIGLKEKIKSLK